MKLYTYEFTRRMIAEDVPTIVRTPQDAVDVIRKVLDGDRLEQEQLVVVVMNTKNVPIAHEVVYRGNVAGSSVRVGEVFKLAVRMVGAAIIVGHNHPSGDVTPSSEDVRITGEFAAAGKLLDIELLDHVIVGSEGRWSSLRAYGALEPRNADWSPVNSTSDEIGAE